MCRGYVKGRDDVNLEQGLFVMVMSGDCNRDCLRLLRGGQRDKSVVLLCCCAVLLFCCRLLSVPDAYVSAVMSAPSSKNPSVPRTFDYAHDKLVAVLGWRRKFQPQSITPADVARQLECSSLYVCERLDWSSSKPFGCLCVCLFVVCVFVCVQLPLCKAMMLLVVVYAAVVRL